ncbi:MAG: chemotaxis protein CheV [Magnetococcales bacterium]|nr:chemotaxis protein CheV [Magnetococcales bacterium]
MSDQQREHKDDLFDEIDQRTNLAMSNEMEMLTFYLNDGQLYGLNVFKIIEIIETPKEITRFPNAHPVIKGGVDFRGKCINLIDLGEYLGMEPVDLTTGHSYMLICEYSTTIQGFLVTQPNILVTKKWDDIIRPEGEVYESSCLTAITYHDDEPIQMLDVEKALNDIIGIDITVSEELVERGKRVVEKRHHILAVDDSKAACMLINSVLDQMGIERTVVDNGPEALKLLERSIGKDGKSTYTVVFTDIEMPIMDGFTFTRKVRKNPKFANIYLAVHSSLSNKTNEYKAKKLGANDFIPKFTPNNMARLVLEQIEKANRIAAGDELDGSVSQEVTRTTADVA